MLPGSGDSALPPAAWGYLARTGLHFEPFSLSIKCGGHQALSVRMLYDSSDGLNACIIDSL